jgi:hypothetical protein
MQTHGYGRCSRRRCIYSETLRNYGLVPVVLSRFFLGLNSDIRENSQEANILSDEHIADEQK